MKTVWQTKIDKICFVLLCALGFVLPILEAPKTLFLALLFLAWLTSTVLNRPSWRRPDLFEWTLIALVLASLASTVANWPFANGIKGLKDTLYWVFVGWFIYRTGYSLQRKYLLAIFISLGTLVALGWGITEVLVGSKPNLEFHSAGVVTQASVYLCIALFAAHGVAYFGSGFSNTLSFRQHLYWWTVTAVMFVGLFLMASRAAILAVFAACTLLAMVIREKRFLIVTSSLFFGAMIITTLLPNTFDQRRIFPKMASLVTKKPASDSDRIRSEIWRVAIEQIKRGDAVLFGIGPRNYKSIDLKNFHFDPPLRTKFNLDHPHNLFLMKYIEEGVLGLAAILFFFLVLVWKLFLDWRGNIFRNWLWVSAIGAVLVPGAIGLVGTPWYQEHAILAMMFIGMYLSSRENLYGKRASNA